MPVIEPNESWCTVGQIDCKTDWPWGPWLQQRGTQPQTGAQPRVHSSSTSNFPTLTSAVYSNCPEKAAHARVLLSTSSKTSYRPGKRQLRSAIGKVTTGLATHWPYVTDFVAYPPTSNLSTVLYFFTKYCIERQYETGRDICVYSHTINTTGVWYVYLLRISWLIIRCILNRYKPLVFRHVCMHNIAYLCTIRHVVIPTYKFFQKATKNWSWHCHWIHQEWLSLAERRTTSKTI